MCVVLQSLFYEILAGVWVRNGLQIKGQAMTYIQANFCNSMVDMDIYWLQICAAHLPADQFLDMCIDMFGVREWLSMTPLSPAQAAEQDAMLEGLLTFLAILVSSRTNLGNDELTQSRLEVSTLLAAGDKTHSQLLELMPERSGNAHTRNFESVLKELSTYRPPPKGSENLEQGLFVPKPVVWEQHYDPLHVLRRARSVCVAHSEGGSRARCVRGVPLLRAFAGGALCDNARTVVAAVPPLHRLQARPHLYPRHAPTYHSDSDTEWEPSESEAGRLPPPNKSVSLPATSTALAVPTAMQMARLVHRNSVPDDQSDAGGDSTEVRALESGSGESQALVLQTLTDSDMDSDNQMTLAIPTQSDLDTPPVPIEYDTTDPLETHWQALPAPPAAPSPPMPSSADTQMQVHSQPDESIPVNESIISLLLKLHSQLSGRLDSFSLEEPAPASQEPIGGAFSTCSRAPASSDAGVRASATAVPVGDACGGGRRHGLGG
ncbi:E3 ubiquitin-protein ligase UBR3 [Papilio xuthus]|uniref:E3 ubiquitin-protein ligase n=1 Tax=Papilio xuthus TaxID=66420 RepID=A0A0N1PJM9_PAPXU|nr:E3 ubiquitin-protein ligase UBR3 [Papilio xuthus]